MKNTLSILTVLKIMLMTLMHCKKDFLELDWCNLNPDAGFCEAAFPKYYYNKNEKNANNLLGLVVVV